MIFSTVGIISVLLLTLLLAAGCDSQKMIDDKVKEREALTTAFIETFREIYEVPYLRYLPSPDSAESCLQFNLEDFEPSFEKEFNLSNYPDESTTEGEKKALGKLFECLINSHRPDEHSYLDITGAEGKITYRKSEDGLKVYVKAEDSIVTYTFWEDSALHTLSLSFGLTITLLGEETEEDGAKREFTLSSLVVNEKEYKSIKTVTYKGERRGLFISAYCDGTPLRCDIQNAYGFYTDLLNK